MGNVAQQEMYRTFNCGIGMVVIVDKNDAQSALDQLNGAGETATIIGVIRQRENNEAQTQVG
jgi:phosphoribosylformylglycinamidine cyclo-ligase